MIGPDRSDRIDRTGAAIRRAARPIWLYRLLMTTTVDARLARLSTPALALFRIIIGLLFALHGAMKLFGWPHGESVPVGTWPVWWAGLIELIVGLLVTVGLFTRISAIIGSGQMAVAYFWMHWPPLEGEPTSFWPVVNGGEPALLYCFGFLLLAATGPGAWALDAMMRRRAPATA
ncbi:DoxX family protein [Mycolicibacterium thermoresistibile ATCC 19527]|uniref:DoxX family protein n=2 Tax=Mycolicibacterium thermoresistibile TaxID=1797 RepID=G7CDZ3_MYCT3|nr:DoxX family protein [Mycolicibacterium thermoresistibile ATCC 19527]